MPCKFRVVQGAGLDHACIVSSLGVGLQRMAESSQVADGACNDWKIAGLALLVDPVQH